MNRLSSFLEKKMLPLANKMSSQKYLKAISASFMTLIPFLTIGSIAFLERKKDWLYFARRKGRS